MVVALDADGSSRGVSIPCVAQRGSPTPTLLQSQVTECGLAALGIVLHHYGCFASLMELRERSGIGRGGTTAQMILETARSFGLEVEVWRVGLASLDAFPSPCIVHLRFNHFVVIEGRTSAGYHVNDPALGPYVLPEEDLDEDFTGVAFKLVPGPDFIRRGHRQSLWATLRARGFGVSAWELSTGAILTLAGGIAALGAIAALGRAVDVAHDPSAYRAALMSLAMMGSEAAGAAFLRRLILERAGARLGAQARARAYERLFRWPMTAARYRRAETIAGMLDGERKLVGDACLAARLALDIPIATAAMILLILASPAAGAVVAGIALCSLAALGLARARALPVSSAPPSLALATETLRRIDSWRINGETDVLFINQMGRLATDLERWQAVGGAAVIGRALLVLGVIAAISAAMMLDGETAGTRVWQAGLAALAAAIVARLVAGRRWLTRLHHLALRAEDFSAVPVETSRAEPNRPALASQPIALVARSLSYAVASSNPSQLANLNLELVRGELVGLSGAVGSGRSTLGLLLAGLLPPNAGEVRVQAPDGSASPEGYVAYLGVTDAFIGSSIADVIGFGHAHRSSEDISRALADAALLGDLSGRPGGLDAPVDDAASNFSGGERRRLSIARALLGNPPFMILDETVDALDDTRVAELFTGLRRRGLGALVITHREQTLSLCDRVLALSQGQLIDGVI